MSYISLAYYLLYNFMLSLITLPERRRRVAPKRSPANIDVSVNPGITITLVGAVVVSNVVVKDVRVLVEVVVALTVAI